VVLCRGTACCQVGGRRREEDAGLGASSVTLGRVRCDARFHPSVHARAAWALVLAVVMSTGRRVLVSVMALVRTSPGSSPKLPATSSVAHRSPHTALRPRPVLLSLRRFAALPLFGRPASGFGGRHPPSPPCCRFDLREGTQSITAIPGKVSTAWLHRGPVWAPPCWSCVIAVLVGIRVLIGHRSISI
jgi:hypothetical protein